MGVILHAGSVGGVPKQSVQAAEFIHEKHSNIWMLYNQVHEPNETEERPLLDEPSTALPFPK